MRGETSQESMNLRRSNVSAVLNKLCREEKLIKINGRHVIYKITEESLIENKLDKIQADEISIFNELIGSEDALNGVHTLLLGEIGGWKTLFTETIHNHAKSIRELDENAPFNCADYVNNPQLLLSYLFGIKKKTALGQFSLVDGL